MTADKKFSTRRRGAKETDQVKVIACCSYTSVPVKEEPVELRFMNDGHGSSRKRPISLVISMTREQARILANQLGSYADYED